MDYSFPDHIVPLDKCFKVDEKEYHFPKSKEGVVLCCLRRNLAPERCAVS